MEPLSILIFIFFWVISSIVSSKNRKGPRPGERRARPGRRAGWPGGPQQPGWPTWRPGETGAPPQAAPAAPEPAVPTPAVPAPSAPAVVSAPTTTIASAIPQDRAQAATLGGVEPEGDGEAGLPAFLTGLLDPQAVITGIVFSEVIGPPKARRERSYPAGRSRMAMRMRWSGAGR